MGSDSDSAPSDRAVRRARSRSPVCRTWNVELVLLSGVRVRILVDVLASMGEIMDRLRDKVGDDEGRRCERKGRLVLLGPIGAEKIESFECRVAGTKVMLAEQVRAMYDRDGAVCFQLLLGETPDAASVETEAEW